MHLAQVDIARDRPAGIAVGVNRLGESVIGAITRDTHHSQIDPFVRLITESGARGRKNQQPGRSAARARQKLPAIDLEFHEKDLSSVE